MNTKTHSRPMAHEEARSLEMYLEKLPKESAGRRDLLAMILYTGGALAIFGTLAWQLAAWILRKPLSVDYGWSHPQSGLIFWLIVLASFLYSILSFVRAGRPGPELEKKIIADLERQTVSVQELDLVAAKLLQEPEHGGRIYFLWTSDERVYVHYDQESQDLGAAGDDPAKSDFTPREKLIRSVAPSTGILLDERFSGEPLSIPAAATISADPEDWPEDGDFLDIPWEQVEQQYAG